MARPVAQLIMARAAEVARLGTYIGAFELVVWSALEQVPVYLVVGGEAHDINQLFWSDYEKVSTELPCHYFVACNIGHKRQLLAVDTHGAIPVFGHYVVGIRVSTGDVVSCIGPVRGTDSLRAVCLRLGLAVVETQAAGDCGIDTMCYHKGSPRTVVEFKRHRARLAAFMHEHADEAKWQACFDMCAETPIHPSRGRREPSGEQPPGDSSASKPLDVGSSSREKPQASASLRAAKRARMASWFRRPYDIGPHVKRTGVSVARVERPAAAKADSPPPMHASVEQPGEISIEVCPVEGSADAASGEVGASLELALVPWSRASAAGAASGERPTVHKWLQSMSPAELAIVTANYDTFALAKAQWLALVPRAPRPARGTPKREATRISRLDHRIAVGMEYLKWAKEVSTKFQLSAFCMFKWKYTGVVPKKQKMWLTRCIKAALQVSTGSQPWKVGASLRLSKRRLVPRSLRARGYGRQGAPALAPMLRETVFDWFLSVRASVAARIPPKLVLMKAKCIATELLSEMRRTQCFIRLPVLTKRWLRGWKQEYGVSLRKPTKRFKVKRDVLRGRLRSMWLSNVRIRALAEACFGFDPPMIGFDQKGIYMNEAGAKNVGMLAFDGEAEVALKDNHGASRTRVSIMTSTVSTGYWIDELLDGLPIEIVFKGLSDRVLKTLEKPDSSNLSCPQTRRWHCMRYVRIRSACPV